MNNPDYLKAINENDGVFRNTSLSTGTVTFRDREDLLLQIIEYSYGINVLGEDILEVDSGLDKDSYDSGEGFIVFDLGDKTLKLDYRYSPWDDPSPTDLYYVEKVVKEVVTTHTYYSRVN